MIFQTRSAARTAKSLKGDYHSRHHRIVPALKDCKRIGWKIEPIPIMRPALLICSCCGEAISDFDGCIVRGDIFLITSNSNSRNYLITGKGEPKEETFWHGKCLVEALEIDPREWLYNG